MLLELFLPKKSHHFFGEKTTGQVIQSDLFGMVSSRDPLKGYKFVTSNWGIKTVTAWITWYITGSSSPYFQELGLPWITFFGVENKNTCLERQVSYFLRQLYT